MRAAACLASIALTAAPLPGVRSPSGNIRCVAGHSLFCSLQHARYAQTLQDRCLNPNGEMGAGVDWHGFELPRTGRGRVLCSGGALWTGTVRYVTVAYGRTWRHGAWTCRSRVTGLTCTNRAGHGLFLSRERWQAW
jgi:hypothetical protein